MSIFFYLRFHIQGIDDPDEAWDKLNKVFGKHNVIQARHLENQIMFLSPNDFPCIGCYLSFKTLRILLKECEIDMNGDQCVYVIQVKLGTAYFVFVSTFYATIKALGDSYIEPSLKSFCDSLIREKDKRLHLRVINTAGISNKALMAQ
jgi:hypothetical protein